MKKFWSTLVDPTCKNLVEVKKLVKKKHPLSRPREKMTFFDQLFHFNQNFHMFGQQVLTKFFHDKKALTFPYTTLTLNFSYLLWSRKYFVLKIKYTRIRFSNNYLHFVSFDS